MSYIFICPTPGVVIVSLQEHTIQFGKRMTIWTLDISDNAKQSRIIDRQMDGHLDRQQLDWRSKRSKPIYLIDWNIKKNIKIESVNI